MASLLVVAGSAAPSGQKPAAAQQTVIVNGRRAVANEVIVRLKDRPVLEEYVDLAWEIDADRSEAVGSRGARRMHSPWIETADLLADFQTHSDVVYAEPNYIVDATDLPNDQQFGNLFGLANTGQTIQGTAGTSGDDIDGPDAWTLTKGSRLNVVAVVDTGIDYTHPDLAANVWSAPATFTVTVGGQSVTCAAGTHGFNAITKTCNPMDDNNHGTHVSGTIGAVGNNGVGVAGVNWVASIMGLKFLSANGSGSIADAVNAIEFAIQAKAAFSSTGGANVRVLSNSWGGGGFSQALLDEINKANANDMLFVAAAGNAASNNDVSPSYPANYNAANVVAVAATDNRDQLASFSNYGATMVDLAAPNVSILSTTRSNGYQYFSSTSMATPHVSGAAALVLSTCALSTASLRSALLNSVDLVAGLSARTGTGGRLNAARAIQSCAGSKVSSVALTPDRTAQQSPGTTVTWTAVPTGGTGPYQYKWWLYDGSSWAAQTGWTASSTYAWTPTVINANYSVAVWVRSAWNSSDNYEATTTVPFAIAARISRLTLSANRASPQSVSVTTTFTAAAVGGKAPYSYKWFVFNGTNWSAVSVWASARTYAWTPSAAGSYSIRAWARSAGNPNDAAEASAEIAFTVTLRRASSLTLTSSVAPPRLTRSTITWTAAAGGGTTPYQYKWYTTSDGHTWTLAGNWATAATFSWTPTTAGARSAVRVWVRGAGNSSDVAEVDKVVSYSIAAPISAVTLTANRVSPQAKGTTVTWTATATGGTSLQQYRFDVTTNGTTWTLARDWGTTRTFGWSPRSAGAYSVRVQARSSVGTASEVSAAVAYVIR